MKPENNKPSQHRTEFNSLVETSHQVFKREALAEAVSLAEANVSQIQVDMEDEIRWAVLGNAGTIISFRVGTEDAQFLSKEMYPVFTLENFINLPNYHIYLKLMIDGAPSKPFSATTLRT